MVNFESADIILILLFFLLVLLAGAVSVRVAQKKRGGTEDYLLSGRNVGLFLFILTNVSTWYGGILGVGELTYNYGLLGWVTQGLPYYVFAILFAVFFSKKIRSTSLFSIPDKIEQTYGKSAALLSAVSIFMLVSPAPYLLMAASLVSMVFKVNMIASLIITAFLSMIYLFRGGYRSDLYTDAVEFFVMFGGFIVMLVWAVMNLGGSDYLLTNLPAEHLSFTGGASPGYISAWFLIALWTFTDPGFHQRCYAARSGEVAKKGILWSILLWMLFDFLTTSVGLYARAALPGLDKPAMSFALLAEKILPAGIKGIFFAGMFATILSTLNSFMFLSASTFGRDMMMRSSQSVRKDNPSDMTKRNAAIGLLITGGLSVLLAWIIPSVIGLWYTIGTIFIPGLILLVIGAYYEKIRIGKRSAVLEIIVSSAASLAWFLLRYLFPTIELFISTEPMLIGMTVSLIIHFSALYRQRYLQNA